MITGFACMPFITSLRNLFFQDIWDLITNILISAFALVSSRIILKLHKPRDLIITIFLFIIQASYIPVYFSQQKPNPDSSAHAFYFAAINSLFEATITNRIPRFKYQAAFRLLLLFFKFTVVPIEDIGQVFVLILCSFFSIYLDYDRDQHDQDLFLSYFNSREQLNKFKNLLANDLPEGIVILSQDLTRCLFANHSFTQLIIQDNSPLDIMASLHRFSLYEISETNEASESLPAFLKSLSKEMQHQKISCNLSCKASSERIFQAKILPLIWDEQPSIALILSDVTQQNEIIRLKVAANLQKDRILATISHELRTPLNGILGMIQIVQQKAHDEETQQYLKICSNSGVLLLGLVNSVLDLNLIRANKFKLYPEKISFSQFLLDIIQLFEYQCKLKSIFIKASICPLIPKSIVTDKNRLSQILINLVGNALKFTAKGGITISAQLSIKDHDYIDISVKDTGIGIKPEDRCKLFQLFGKLEQEPGGTVVNRQGIGLGLTISDNLAKLLCKNPRLEGIRLDSEYGKGCAFSFSIRKNLEMDCCSPTGRNDQDGSCGEIPSLDLDEGRTELQEGQKKYYFSLLNNHALSDKTITSTRPCQRSQPEKELVVSDWLAFEEQPERSVSSQLSSLTINRPKTSTEMRLKGRMNKTISVLIVDDNPLNVSVVGLMIRKQNYQVKTAFYGQTAIDIMLQNDHQQNQIQLILMDLQMPIMDGCQTTEMLIDLMKKKKIPETPIVALTANDSEDERKTCKVYGMCDYLTKPLREKVLIETLKKYCEPALAE